MFAHKIWRETQRLGRQAMGLPAELVQKLYFRRWYDAVTSRRIRRSKGELQPQSEMAIYVIYPSQGLQPSHLHALQQIIHGGISPVVVSNLPLSDEERARLLPLCTLLLERPNVGYDFGGYRDGVFELAAMLAGLDRLWFLNDSCWLLPQARSWFTQARLLDLDLVGATSNYGFLRPAVRELRPFPWTYSHQSKHFHYASYALGFGSRVLSSPDFLRFWRRLDLRNDKKKTVRRGEIGLTQWAIRQGYSHGCTTSLETLDGVLASLSDQDIDAIARDLIILEDPPLMALWQVAFRRPLDTAAGRTDRTVIILMAVARKGGVYALAGYLAATGFSFLKKSPLRPSTQAGATMGLIISRLNGPMAPLIREEAQRIGQHNPSGGDTP